MKSNYKIGDIVRLADAKNRDGKCTNLLGLSMNKEFRPSTSNIVGTDLTKYKIVKKYQFAVDFMSAIRVHKMPIALNLTDDDILVSPAYAVFEVKDENIVLPEYLMLWFKRDEFDRYADFKSDSAIRGGYDWQELCNTDIHLPSIEEQKKIVASYNVVERRICLKRQINDNLEAIIQATFLNLHNSLSDDSACSLSEFCTLASSKRIFAEEYVASGVPFYRGGEITSKNKGLPISDMLYITTDRYKEVKNKYGVPKREDILLTAVGTLGNAYLVQDEEFYFKDGNIIWLKDFVDNSNYYIYDYLSSSLFRNVIEGISIGSTQKALTIVSLSNIKIKKPSTKELSDYYRKSKIIRTQIQNNINEISKLISLQSIILSTLSR